MRVAEVLEDFRGIQHRIAQYQVNPPQGDYHEAGYGILRQCHAEAQALLAPQFNPGQVQNGPAAEQTRRLLLR
jgi:hypothetical protein